MRIVPLRHTILMAHGHQWRGGCKFHCAVRSDVSAIPAPFPGHDLFFTKSARHLTLQKFRSKTSVEILNKAVPSPAPRLDILPFDLQSFLLSPDRKFRAVVRADILRSSFPCNQPGKHIRYVVELYDASHTDYKELAAVFVNHGRESKHSPSDSLSAMKSQFHTWLRSHDRSRLHDPAR